MANKKFSEFDLKTSSSDVAFVVGFNGSDNVRIAPSNLAPVTSVNSLTGAVSLGLLELDDVGSDGTNGQVLTTNGSGSFTFTTASGGASSLNGLSDCLVDGNSVYLAEVPSGLSGNPVDNTVFGKDAGQGLTTGLGNTFIGFEAAKLITDSDNMVIIGRQAGGAGSGGSSMVAIGYQASRSNTADRTIAIGYQAAYSQTSGTGNTAVGERAAYSNTTGENNTSIGDQTAYSSTGSKNTSVGKGAFGGGFGHSGTDNVAIGYLANQQPSGASNYNVAIGSEALRSSGTRSNNVAVGYKAGTSITSGGSNTFLGYQAGDSLTTGSNNTVIGNDAEPSAVDATNEITLGNSSVATLRCQVQTISSLSDSRDKTNIQASTYGLDFINKLNPVTFDWDMRDGAKVGDKDLGFLAQELQEVDDENLQLVYANNTDRLEASYGRLIPVLVKAIQDLSAKVTALENA